MGVPSQDRLLLRQKVSFGIFFNLEPLTLPINCPGKQTHRKCEQRCWLTRTQERKCFQKYNNTCWENRVLFTQKSSGIPLRGDVPVTVFRHAVLYRRTQNKCPDTAGFPRYPTALPPTAISEDCSQHTALHASPPGPGPGKCQASPPTCHVCFLFPGPPPPTCVFFVFCFFLICKHQEQH